MKMGRKYCHKKHSDFYNDIVLIAQRGYVSAGLIYNELIKKYPDIELMDVYNAIKQMKKHKILFSIGIGKGGKVSAYEKNKIILTKH